MKKGFCKGQNPLNLAFDYIRHFTLFQHLVLLNFAT
jgi:hypothetical protein